CSRALYSTVTPEAIAQPAASDGGGALDGDGGGGQPRAQAAALGDDDAHGAAVARAPLALVVLVAAQEIEGARARLLRALDGVGHEHGAGAVAVEVEVEAREVVVDARAVGEAVEGGARLAVDAQAVQAQPAAIEEAGGELAVETAHRRAGEGAA